MIGRQHRFHGYGSLRYTYQHGKTVRGPLMAIKSVPNDRRTSYRLAVVVSKKVNKSAVVRNRIRRRLYEVFRHQFADLHRPYDVVVTVFHDRLAELPQAELEQIVRSQLRQAGMDKK